MSSRSPKLYIQDILQACEDILNFTQGLGTADELQNDRCSEGVLVKYSVKFRVQKVFKADRPIKPGDVIFTRWAIYLERPEDVTFELKDGRSKILFLRKTEYEKDSFENTSIRFGAMPHTKQREMLLGFETKEATDKKSK